MRTKNLSATESGTIIWVSLSVFFALGALVLSLLGQLNRGAFAVLLVAGIAGSAWLYRALTGGGGFRAG